MGLELRLEQPAWLWIGVVLVPMTLVAIWWFSTMSSARRWSAIIFRVTLVLLLAAALADLGNVQRSDSLALVALVDTSDSVKRLGAHSGAITLDRVQGALQSLEGSRGPEDLLGVVAFDTQPRTVALPRAVKGAGRPLDGGDGKGTNIQKAIEHAISLLPPESAGRLLLISDGNQTAGDALDAARRAANIARKGVGGRRGVSIDVLPIEYDVKNEVMVESVDAPPQAAQGSTINLRVRLFATQAARGRLGVLDEGNPVDLNGSAPGEAREVTLQAGANVIVVPVQLDPHRVHRFEVVFENEGTDQFGIPFDTFSDNNRGSAFTLTPGRGSVLVIDGVGGGDVNAAGGVLTRTLRENGIETTIVAPEGVQADLLWLSKFDLIVLQNVPAESVPLALQDMLVTQVRDFGTGLVMTGGADSFAAGGWKGSHLEPVLPVNLEIPDRVVTPDAAIMLVLDNSGSMGFYVMGSTRSKMDIANEAAVAAVKLLEKRDLLGIIAFNSDYETIVPLGPNVEPDKTAQKIRRIYADGGTNLAPALEAAARALAPVKAKVKHILVVSDGRSQNHEALPGMAGQIHASGITISTISVGDDADPVTMGDIAQQGGGKHYEVVNPSVLPRVFLKAIRVARSPYVRETPFTPRISDASSPLIADLPDLPPLGGLSMAEIRRDPTIFQALVTPTNEPVLAHWNVGLGQVVAFTSDTHKWASTWVDSPVYRTFWTRLARSCARVQSGEAAQARVESADGKLNLYFQAAETGGTARDALVVAATVYRPDGSSIQVPLEQTASAEYRGSLPIEGDGSYVAVFKPKAGDRPLSPVLAGASARDNAELRRLKSDRELLAAIAQESGGRVLGLKDLTRETAFHRGGVVPQELWTALTRYVLIAALVILLLDIATRRVAWDRLFSSEFGAAPVRAVASRDAAATLDRLRSVEAVHEVMSGQELSEVDGKRLAQQQADRRRAERLVQYKSAAAPKVSTKEAASETTEGDSSGLMAAKRRAAKRFEDDGT